jgi:hypothetical protein
MTIFSPVLSSSIVFTFFLIDFVWTKISPVVSKIFDALW